VEHLHEVRAADQSAGVAEEDEQDRAPAQVLQPPSLPGQVGEVEGRRCVTDARRERIGH